MPSGTRATEDDELRRPGTAPGCAGVRNRRAHRRTVVLAALALCVPLPAFALTGDDPAAETAGTLGVSAALDSCGIAGSSVVCKIDASWNSVEGATSYSASVTSPDGSVVDYGDAGGSGTGFWVPYVGPGTYTVTVSAYGDPPGEDKRELLTRDSSSPGEKKAQVGTYDADGDGVPDEEEPPEEEPVEEPPACEEDRLPEPVPEGDGGNKDSEGELTPEEQAALAEQAQLPEDVDCPPSPAE